MCEPKMSSLLFRFDPESGWRQVENKLDTFEKVRKVCGDDIVCHMDGTIYTLMSKTEVTDAVYKFASGKTYQFADIIKSWGQCAQEDPSNIFRLIIDDSVDFIKFAAEISVLDCLSFIIECIGL